MLMTVEKLRTYIETEESDELLTERLTALECLIRSYTHNNFQVRSIRSQSAVRDELILSPPLHIEVGDTVQISDSLLNNGLYTVETISEQGMTVTGAGGRLYDCNKNLVTLVGYPPDLLMGTVNMLKWDMANRDKVGVQSETVSRHSVTYFNMDGDNAVMGYPRSLLGFLKPYMKARF